MNGDRCVRTKKCANNDSCAFKRTIRNNPTLEHWRVRNSSVQLNEILHPDEGLEKAKSECSCDCSECDCTGEVTKTQGKIKWRGEKKVPSTKSKYHTKCCIKKPESPRFEMPSKVKRNQVLSSTQCDKCSEKRRRTKFKNECYCNSKPDKPLIPIKPPVTQPNTRRTIVSGIKSPESEPNHDLETLKKAKSLLQDYAPESNFLKKLQKEARQVFDCQCSVCKMKEKCANLQYTKRRQMLEDAYDGIEKTQSLENFGRIPHKCKPECDENYSSTDSLVHYPPKTTLHVSSQNSPRKTRINYDSDTSLPSSPIRSCCADIHAVKQIRNEHYFDTHSTRFNLVPECGPDKKCLHKFALDDRFLPEPLNADAFGVSRCVKCNRPMKSISDDYKKELNQKQNLVRNKAGRCTARRINIADKDEIVELKVPPILISNQKDYELKYPLPHNTWALRHQRRVN